MADAHHRRRLFSDAVAQIVVTTCGLLSIALLLGIFTLLAVNATRTLLGGVELAELTPIEQAMLTPEEIAAIEALPHEPPGLLDFVDTTWRPDSRTRPRYGVLAMVASTLMTTLGAMALAVPVGLAVAAWLTFSAGGWTRDAVKFGVELIAAIPSVVIGFLGITVVGPAIAVVTGAPGGLNALNGAILLALMALPTITSLSEDALDAVPRSLIQGSLALGADRWQTLLFVALPAARSGLLAAVMLGMGRAIGETMTVLMATGNALAMPTSFLDPVRTMTATIATELGEVPQGTTHYFALFAVGLLLFLITLGIQLATEVIQHRQRRMLG